MRLLQRPPAVPPLRALGIAGVVLTVLFAPEGATARSRPPSSGRSFFLGASPHVPLATMSPSGRIRSAVSARARGKSCGSTQRWARVGSEWRAIDSWGQVAATVRIDATDLYDVTGCREVSFSPALPDDGALLFVSKDSPWRPSASARWFPAASESASFERSLAAVSAGHSQSQLPSQYTDIKDDVLYFQVPNSSGSPRRFAVGGRRGAYAIASLGTDWSLDLVKKEPVNPAGFTLCYRPVAVFDMNGDGVPEVVMRKSEGASWGDFVLSLGASGKWVVVAESPGGSTA